MIDTHSHVYFDQFDSDRDAVISRCLKQLGAVITVGVDMQTSIQAINIAKPHDSFYAVVGFNPEAAVKSFEQYKSFEPMIRELKKLVDSSDKIVGIGEIGLDYHWPEYASEIQIKYQKEGFKKQIEFSLDRDLPIVIHSRDAFADTVALLSEYSEKERLTGVWHSFVDDWESMQQILSLGLYVGVNGIITYPSAQKLQTAVTQMPLERLLLETDAPFLAPVPVRGQRNEPVYVRYVAEEIRRLKDVSIEEIERQTDRNVRKLFELF